MKYRVFLNCNYVSYFRNKNMESLTTKYKKIPTIVELRNRYPINLNNVPNKSEEDQIRVYKTIGRFAKNFCKTESLDQEDLAKRSAAVDDLRLFIKEFQEYQRYQKLKDSAILKKMRSQASGKNKKKKKKNPYLDLQGDLELHLFGSTTSGFGFKGSDLDCCLLVRNPTTKKIFPTAIEAGFTSEKATTEILLLANTMRSSIVPRRKWHENQKKYLPIFREIEPIPDAKVPIVKFKHAPSDLKGDISICNTLALRNTKMLKTYANFEPIVVSLGFLLKKMAKQAEICDGKDALSSYAYILLLIHYLQKVQIIPNLQEGSQKPENQTNCMIAGCNTYFVNEEEYPEKLKLLKEIYAEKPHKQMDQDLLTGQLFVNLLKYYAYDFDWENSVVNLRLTQEPDLVHAKHTGLTRLTKKWTSSLCIEDPFDLNHNLGCGVSKIMSVYIVKIFIQAYHLFFNSKPPTHDASCQKYYLKRENLQKNLSNKIILRPPDRPKGMRKRLINTLNQIENESIKNAEKLKELESQIQRIEKLEMEQEKTADEEERQKNARHKGELIKMIDKIGTKKIRHAKYLKILIEQLDEMTI